MPETAAVLDFGDSLKPREVLVRNLFGRSYWLRELSEEGHCAYMDAVLAGYVTGPDGKPRPAEGSAKIPSLLVSCCLYEADPDGERLRILQDGRPDPEYLVPLHVVRGWPNRVVEPLASRIREMSDMVAETEGALRKAAVEAQDRLDRFLHSQSGANGAAGDPAKNSRGSTTATSASPTG